VTRPACCCRCSRRDKEAGATRHDPTPLVERTAGRGGGGGGGGGPGRERQRAPSAGVPTSSATGATSACITAGRRGVAAHRVETGAGAPGHEHPLCRPTSRRCSSRNGEEAVLTATLARRRRGERGVGYGRNYPRAAESCRARELGVLLMRTGHAALMFAVVFGYLLRRMGFVRPGLTLGAGRADGRCRALAAVKSVARHGHRLWFLSARSRIACSRPSRAGSSRSRRSCRARAGVIDALFVLPCEPHHGPRRRPLDGPRRQHRPRAVFGAVAFSMMGL